MRTTRLARLQRPTPTVLPPPGAVGDHQLQELNFACGFIWPTSPGAELIGGLRNDQRSRTLVEGDLVSGNLIVMSGTERCRLPTNNIFLAPSMTLPFINIRMDFAICTERLRIAT